MKQLTLALFAIVLGVGLIMDDADAAKRFGGGASSGMQRSQPLKRDTAPSQNAAPAPAPQQSGASRWLGPLAGLAAGIGLASLFSYLGMGEEFSSIVMLLLIAAAVVFVFRLLARRLQPAAQRVQYAGGAVGPAAYDTLASGASATTRSSPMRAVGPAGFDAESFVRQAKLNFLRLQAANDEGNLEDIRRFTTPEMFAEIKLRIQERGAAPQKTDVVTLDAELLEVTTELREHIASVRFFGTIRETAGAAPEAFDEIWHLTKPVDDGRDWKIAGIQQAS